MGYTGCFGGRGAAKVCWKQCRAAGGTGVVLGGQWRCCSLLYYIHP